MTNLENLTLQSVMQSISNAAPALILCAAIGTFTILGYFQADYYKRVLDSSYDYAYQLGIVAAVIIETVRFVLLVSSMRDFEKRKTFSGTLGIIASIGLVWHDWVTCNELSLLIGRNLSFLNFLVILGLILEFRLILTVTKNVDNRDTEKKYQNRYYQNGIPKAID